jgi:ribonuclease BN (tRNA processing enzyme)
MSPPYFPVDVRHLPSHRTYHTVTDEQCIVWKYASHKPTVNGPHNHAHAGKAETDVELRVITKFTQSHPLNGAVIYRIEYAGKRIVYATDVEWKEGRDPDFLAFIEEADLLIHDAQYTAHDYEQVKHGYGHSTVKMATEAAQAAHVRELILFHHEPTYDDDQLDRMEAQAQTLFAHTRSAREGMEIDLLATIE